MHANEKKKSSQYSNILLVVNQGQQLKKSNKNDIFTIGQITIGFMSFPDLINDYKCFRVQILKNHNKIRKIVVINIFSGK